MKVFFFVGSFKLGGTEKVAIQVGEELTRIGHDVRFVALRPANDFNMAGATVLLPSKPQSRISDFIVAWKALRKLLRNEKPAYIVAFSIGLDFFLFLQFYFNSIFVVDTNIFVFKRKWYYKYILKVFILFPQVKKVVVPSEGLKTRLSEFLFPTRKLICVGNPLDDTKIDSVIDEPIEGKLKGSDYVVSAGRLASSKGFDGLIRAYSRSRSKDVLPLVIIGKGPEEATLMELISNLGLEEKVFLLGFVSNPYKYFRNSRCFVLNTKFESFANVVMEALYCSVPVLCADCDFGPRELIAHGVNGFLYEVGNEDELVGRLDELALSEGLRSTMKVNAKPSVARFGLRDVARAWVDNVFAAKS